MHRMTCSNRNAAVPKARMTRISSVTFGKQPFRHDSKRQQIRRHTANEHKIIEPLLAVPLHGSVGDAHEFVKLSLR